MGSLRRIVPFAVVALAALAASPARAGDIVVNQQGKPLGNPKAAVPPGAGDFAGSGWEILDETLDGVTYRIEGVAQAQSLPASSVKAVYHDPETVPAALSAGDALMDRGDYAGARDQFARVAKDAEALPWAKGKAAFRAAESLLAEGNFGEAEKQLAAFKSAFPKSKWVTTATDRRARALLAMEKIEDAKAEFASLKKLPGVDEAVSVEADFYVISIDEQVAIRRNDQAALAACLKAYDALLTRIQGKAQFESTARLCQIGKASCMIFLGRAGEAKEALEKLSKETKDARVLAAIHNKLGMATWRAAPTDKAQMKAALFQFLRVVTLYGDEAGAEEDAAEATFHAGELFRELKEMGPDYLARARREWTDVVQKYPGSAWAQRAKEALAGR